MELIKKKSRIRTTLLLLLHLTSFRAVKKKKKKNALKSLSSASLAHLPKPDYTAKLVIQHIHRQTEKRNKKPRGNSPPPVQGAESAGNSVLTS